MVLGTWWPAARSGFPSGLQVGGGALAVVVATMAGSLLPASDCWRVAPVAIVVLVFAMISDRVGAVAFTAALGYLMAIGFLVNQFGQLSWHGGPDADRLLLVVSAAAMGFITGAARRRYLRNRPLTVPAAWSAPVAAQRVQETLPFREDVPNA
jgi:hypothetical protein